MSKAYTNLLETYRKHHIAQFNMAIAHLMDIGFRNAAEITDEDINEAKGNALMTDEFWQDTLKLVREIAQNYKPVELIQFCEVEEPFDVRYFAECPMRKDLKAYVVNAIGALCCRGVSDEDIVSELGLEEDAELFGFEYEEEEDE